ncbi:MAG: rplD [Acidobacteria bacterium]|jgi:large subunit ribosomal protein L4|nr:rplD [Acidobacteriota bacterium]
MNIDVVNDQNEKVGSIELDDALVGGRDRAHLIWESVVHANAAERRGTHATKTRGLVSGTGKKPWRQKGTGRARVGEARNPLWRKGGTVFGPQPRSYGYRVPRKVERGALRAALVEKVKDGMLVVVDRLAAEDGRTKSAAALLARLGAGPKALLVDVSPDRNLQVAVRNLAGVRLVPSRKVTARDIAGTPRVIATKAAVERLQEVMAR